MTYISSSCVKNIKIIDSVKELAKFGFQAIELSGGTKPYANIETDLLAIKNDLGLDLLLHNYFPPPTNDFVLNLASSNSMILKSSLDHCKNAIHLSATLGAKQYGFHAGFFLDIAVREIGKKISNKHLEDKDKSYDIFCESVHKLQKFAGKDVKLYIENNVFSKSNFESFNGENPLMLTDVKGYELLKNKIDFNLLLDVAHLKVSSQTLGNDFNESLNELFSKSEYIHISDNDGQHDTNKMLTSNSTLFKDLSKLNWNNKTVTIEVYESLEKLMESKNNINNIIHA